MAKFPGRVQLLISGVKLPVHRVQQHQHDHGVMKTNMMSGATIQMHRVQKSQPQYLNHHLSGSVVVHLSGTTVEKT
jgi:hypothetical protein